MKKIERESQNLKKVVFVTGGNGQLGQAIKKTLDAHFKCILIPREELLEPDMPRLKQRLYLLQPFCLINCAAIVGHNNVRRDLDLAVFVNAKIPELLAELSLQNNSLLIHVSTNSVFEGAAGQAFYEEDTPQPLSDYAKLKHQGELAVMKKSNESIVLRVPNLHSNNFGLCSNMLTKLYADIHKGEVTISRRELLSPTDVLSVGKAVLNMLNSNIRGFIHCSDSGVCNWDELVDHLCCLLQIKANVIRLYKGKDPYIISALRSNHSFGGYQTWQEGITQSIESRSFRS
jgi:dTDP-4-dehydrorhamnose reductase